MPAPLTKPENKVRRYYARDDSFLALRVKFTEFNRSPERATFPLIGDKANIPALEGTGPMTVGAAEPAKRESEAMVWWRATTSRSRFGSAASKAPMAGRYKVRLGAYSF